MPEQKNQIEQEIKNALRRLAEGEQREPVRPDRIECPGRTVIFVVRSGQKELKLQTDAPPKVRITAFTQNVGPMQFGCGGKFPPLPADARGKSDGESVALEIVPEGFALD